MIEDSEFGSNFIKPEISIQECRAVLCSDGEQYTDDEIKEIRTLILQLVEIDFFYFNSIQEQKGRQQKTINIRPEEGKPYKKAG